MPVLLHFRFPSRSWQPEPLRVVVTAPERRRPRSHTKRAVYELTRGYTGAKSRFGCLQSPRQRRVGDRLFNKEGRCHMALYPALPIWAASRSMVGSYGFPADIPGRSTSSTRPRVVSPIASKLAGGPIDCLFSPNPAGTPSPTRVTIADRETQGRSAKTVPGCRGDGRARWAIRS